MVEIPDVRGAMIESGMVLLGADLIAAFGQGYYEGLQLNIAAQWFGAGVFGKFLDKGFWLFTLSLPHHLRLMYVRSGSDSLAVKILDKRLSLYQEKVKPSEDIPAESVKYARKGGVTVAWPRKYRETPTGFTAVFLRTFRFRLADFASLMTCKAFPYPIMR